MLKFSFLISLGGGRVAAGAIAEYAAVTDYVDEITSPGPRLKRFVACSAASLDESKPAEVESFIGRDLQFVVRERRVD